MRLNKNYIFLLLGIIIVVLIAIFGYSISVNSNKNYEIDLLINGNNYGDKILVKNGYIENLPTPPIIDGYTFDYWEYNGKKFNISMKIESKKNINAVYKKMESDYIIVTIKYNNGELDKKIKIEPGSSLSNLSIPKKQNQKFIGWYCDNKLFDLSTPIYNDILLEAKFIENDYEVTLHNNATGEEKTITVYYGGTYEDLPTPKVEGHTFIGWYSQPASGEEITNTTKVTRTENHTLYARFRQN